MVVGLGSQRMVKLTEPLLAGPTLGSEGVTISSHCMCVLQQVDGAQALGSGGAETETPRLLLELPAPLASLPPGEERPACATATSCTAAAMASLAVMPGDIGRDPARRFVSQEAPLQARQRQRHAANRKINQSSSDPMKPEIVAGFKMKKMR